MEKIFKYLLTLALIEVIATGLIVFYFVKIGLAQTIDIGVTPTILRFNSTGTYVYEFCFFNQGDTDAEVETLNGEVTVQYQSFIVPARTNYNNCVKKQLLLTVTQPGYFYITAKPKGIYGEVPDLKKVGIRVYLINYVSPQTTSTTIVSQTQHIAEILKSKNVSTFQNSQIQTTPKSNTLSIIDIAKIVFMIGVIAGLIYLFIYIIQIA
jgi:hypothetical protein